jgi:hypothetical protein
LTVEASLLFTHAPKMMPLPAELLNAYKPSS